MSWRGEERLDPRVLLEWAGYEGRGYDVHTRGRETDTDHKRDQQPLCSLLVLWKYKLQPMPVTLGLDTDILSALFYNRTCSRRWLPLLPIVLVYRCIWRLSRP